MEGFSSENLHLNHSLANKFSYFIRQTKIDYLFLGIFKIKIIILSDISYYQTYKRSAFSQHLVLYQIKIVKRANCTGLNFRSFKLFEGPIVAFDSKTRPQAPKTKIFKNEKKNPDIYRNKCAKFQPNPTIFEVSRLPQSILGQTHTQTNTHRHTFSDSSSTEVEKKAKYTIN